jgi:putative transposase
MARPLRIELAGGLYHVTARGDRRDAIFLNDGDRRRWLDLLGEVCDRFHWRCHAYCQMTNHYHIVVETPEGNLARGMRQLNGVYTQFINRTHRRVGHVFQGRYKGILVEKDSYLLELARYVVLNPVRARMVADAGEWPWSSYRMMTGQESAPPWLETDWLLGQFGPDRPRAICGYIDFVRAGVGLPSIWEGLRDQIFLGSEPFVERLKQSLPEARDLREVPRIQRRPLAKPLAHYLRLPDRRKAMALAYRAGGYTMQQIADAFGVHYATVSRTVRAAEEAEKSDMPMLDCKA